LQKKPKQTAKYKRKSKRLLKTILPITLVVGLFLSLIYFSSKYGWFKISTVKIVGTKTYVNDTDIYELTKTRVIGKNLFTFESNDLRSVLLENFQGAKDVVVTKQPPKTIKVKVIERVPLAVVQSRIDGGLYLVDEDGYVLGQIEQGVTNLPEVSYDGEIAVGFFLKDEVVSVYFDLINELDSSKIKTSSISVYSDYVQLYVDDSVEVLVNETKDAAKAISTLAKIIEYVKTTGNKLAKVDLRYDKVIVSYK